MGRRVFVVGVGMTKFEKPGRRNWDYPDMGRIAAQRALDDAGIDYKEVQQAVVGYVYGDSTCGQRALYELGLTGIPMYNVNNNCSTGSTALFLSKQLIEGGIADCVLAVGFEKMDRGSLGSKFNDRTNPMDKHMTAMMEKRGFEPKAPPAAQLFGNAGREHMERYGTTKTHFAKIAEKNHRHSANNPYSQFRDIYTLEQILQSPLVYEPLTKLQCCPTSDGGAAAVLASEDFVRKHNLQHQAVEIIGMAMATDLPSTFSGSSLAVVGVDMTAKAAREAFRMAGVSPADVQVVELHDCFSCNELVTYEALGLCGPGEAGQFVDRGDNTYGGKYVVNPSGGLISKGHPLGATGLAQCAELSWQLRRMAGPRQVPNATVALQHNIGLGGAVVVSLYRLGWPEAAAARPPVPPGRTNPAVVAEGDDAPAAAQPAAAAGFKSDAVFGELANKVKSEPGLVQRIGGVYHFVIRGGPDGNTVKSWTVDLKNGAGQVREGPPAGAADCTVRIDDADYVDLMSGKANAQTLFGKGKIKIEGNMAFTMKLSQLRAQKAAL